MKPTDYVVKRGIEKLLLQRGVDFNGKVSNLTVELKLNHNKGLFAVTPKLTNDQIGDVMVDNEHTMKTLSELSLEAMKKGIAWRTEWKMSRREDDPTQMDAFGPGNGLPGEEE